MRFAKIAYVVAVVLFGVASLWASVLPQETGLLLMIGLQTLTSVLTYPLGFIASLVSGGLTFSGTTTLLEAILLTTPLFAALGYLQWFWLLPRIYGASRNAANDTRQTPSR